ncbi:hypothetical protein RTG_00088 [Rhodotorula toruloides ATCC 204091]|uniref:Transmembrane protein n=1 Tax=Rhodotorula toruloides TaxID=5286 RepID=A0A0K3CC78_RHOTO|nr:hypothetical protein RTG_00088 [Rhodotorula toruloides ATCC 204091]PRQ76331.1 hypothetical protein AAT19DRAFT_13353 [Rhodotorula toruloides]
MSLTPSPSDPAVTDPSKRIAPVLEQDRSDEIRAGAHLAYSFAASGWLALLSIPLLAFPRVLSLVFGSLLAEMGDPDAPNKPTAHVVRTLNVLERSLAGLAGMALLALAGVLVIQTGALPLTTSISTTRDVATSSLSAPYRAPTLWISIILLSSLSYSSYTLNLLSISVPSALLAAWGCWVVLFGHEGRVNQQSARASSYPFGNVEAEKEKQGKRE